MRKLICFGILLLFLTIMFPAAPAEAVQFKAQSEFSVPAGKTFTEDFYIFAQDIVIDGTVKGDVYCVGSKVELNGRIEGDLVAAADIVTINGFVQDDVKLAGAEVDFRGEVTDSVMAAGQEVIFEKDTKIGGDLIAAAESLKVGGVIGGRLKGSASGLIVSANVKKDTVLRAGSIALVKGALLEKNLSYTAANELKKDEGALIRGKVKRRLVISEEKPSDAFFGALGDATWKFLQVMILGLVLITLLPASVQKVNEKLDKQPLAAAAYGLGYLLLAVPVILGIIITIIGIPLGIIVLSLFAISVDLAKVYVAIWAGRLIAAYSARKELKGPLTELALGALLYAVLVVLPVFGTLVQAAVLLFGLGAILLAGLDFIQHSRRKKTEPAL